MFVNEDPLDVDKLYKVAMSDFTANGKDGYDILTTCKVLVDDENAVELKQLITSFLDEAKPDENEGELALYKSNLEIFSPHVIRRLINMKMGANRLAKKVKSIKKSEETVTLEPPIPTITKSSSHNDTPGTGTGKHHYQRSSSMRRLDQEAANKFKSICEEESEKPAQTIDMTLLKRLRKYQLLGEFHPTPTGKQVPGVCPREEGRIAILSPGQ